MRSAVKESESNYVIGIDRGERNLLYICVLNDNGEIVEQESLNTLVSKTGYAVDYHDLLSRKQAALDAERKNWRSIENIKELKEGYLSQAIRKICDLVIKYDAIIAMEDLNFGFKRGRFHVEKQVYQKFENMLASKLSYLVNKGSAPSDSGGLLKAYQLALAEDMSSYGRQNGFIFYVPAWLTSKIDPKTGFVNLFNTKYVSVEKSVEFVKAIDAIRYDDESDTFEFDVDYEKFPRGSIDHRRKWTISSHGERIINTQSRRNDIVKPTEEFKALFSDFRIDYRINLKKQIEEQSAKEFFGRFMSIFSHVLQMRNSISSSDEDYLISPVKGNDGVFFDSRRADASMPKNADANGAYNIARKALWAIHVLKNTPDDELKSAKLSVDKAAWLKFAQYE